MTTALWTPPGAKRASRATVPDRDVRLSDGRTLKRGKYPIVHEESKFFAIPFIAQNGLQVISWVERTEKFGDLLHVSVAYPKSDPTWRDLKVVRDAFYAPHHEVVIRFPRTPYITDNEHTVHLWQQPEAWDNE